MTVEHERGARRFVIHLPGGDAELSYRPAGAGVLDYQHTFVPPSARGRGIAARLVTAALEYAREQNQRVTPSCWYVREFMASHPEHQDLLAD